MLIFSAIHASFLKNATALVETMDNIGNPFSYTSGDLLALDTRKIMNAAVIDSVRNLEELGNVNAKSFITVEKYNAQLQSLIGQQRIICIYSDGALTMQNPVRRNSWPRNGTGICFQLYKSPVTCGMLILQTSYNTKTSRHHLQYLKMES